MNKDEEVVDKIVPIRAIHALLVTFPHLNMKSQPLFYLMQENGHANDNVLQMLKNAKNAAGHNHYVIERTVSD